MKRQALPTRLGLLLAAAVAFSQAGAGEQPGPGLEIIDSGVGIDTPVVNGGVQQQDPYGSVPYQQPYIQTQPDAAPYIQGTIDPYAVQPTTNQGFIGEPYVDPNYTGQPYVDPTYTGQPYADPNYPAEQYATDAPGGEYYPEDAEGTDAPPPPVQETYDPVASTLASFNVRNPNFPGLEGAVAQGNLQAAGDIIWQVLRERRVVSATLARGPGASAGMASSFESQMVFNALNFDHANQPDSPVLAAQRIDVILDSFQNPIIDDYGFGSNMQQLLIRLNIDIYTVRNAIAETSNDSDFQELSRVFIRAATNCDFFSFPRKELADDINAIMVRSAPLFFQDGASIGGDVAGVTGNLFQNLLALDFFTRDDSRFRRDIGSLWKVMEKPSRYLLGVACPDQTVPRFGPRGSRELGPLDIAKLEIMYPKSSFAINRIGLASSHSYPNASNQNSYGGIFASRSGPEPTARYMAIRFGPLGTLCDVPAHHDFGSMVLMSRTVKFIVDAGGYGGEAAGAYAHNVLSLDGQYVVPESYNQGGQPVDTVWRTNASMDYVTDLATFADGKTWQRTMIYVKDLPGESRSDYWLLLDNVGMNGDGEQRQARLRFQLAPGIQAYHDGSGILATASYGDGSALRIFAINENSELTVSEGQFGLFPSHTYDSAGGSYAAPSVTLSRKIVGDSTTATLLYPSENMNNRPARIERDADIIRGRTGAVVIDHGFGRIDVIAWAPPGTELVTPTLNLQLSADLAVFRIRDGKIKRVNFVNLERFQAKEPNGGIWSMRVSGMPQTLTLEPEKNGGWQILSDPANQGAASLYDINLGPAITRRKVGIRPGDMRVIVR